MEAYESLQGSTVPEKYGPNAELEKELYQLTEENLQTIVNRVLDM